MVDVTLIRHVKGAPLFRIFGLGPNFIPVNAIQQLQLLLDKNSFWAMSRSKTKIRKMIEKSSCIVTLWSEKKLIGFGRATSDCTYRATLWDIVVAKKYQKSGLGKLVVNALLQSSSVMDVEKVYLMTTKSQKFYRSCAFEEVLNQSLLCKTMQN